MNSPSAHPGAGPRPSLSFGFKLMLEMVLLMAGVCVGAMLVLRVQVERNYRTFLNGIFEKQVGTFFEKQKKLLPDARAALEPVMHSVRVLAAIEDRDLGHLYSDLNTQLQPQLISLLARFNGSDTAGSFAFYRVFDAEGNYLAPPSDADVTKVPGLSEDQLAAALAPFVRAAKVNLAASTRDVMDYPVLGGSGQSTNFQLMTLPIVDSTDGEVKAFLAFGVELDPKTYFGQGASDQKNGLLLNDQRLVSDALPATLAQPLARFVKSQGLAANGEEFKNDADGRTYLLFFRSLHGNDLFPAWVTLYSLSGLAELTSGINIITILIIPVSISAGMILAAFVTRRFTRPILDLVRATEAVGRGNFSTRVPVRRRDEVGRLSAAFNTMTADLALKEKYRHVLDRVTDREIAEQLLNGELSLGGELRQASVLFCDIRGFTTLTEGMDPVAVIEMLNLHMTALTNVVHRHHGVVDKFVGDALMAIFGAPKSYGADAFDAAACALDLMVERQRLNVTGGRVIEIGIGVATGRVVAGCTGSAERLNYTVLGDRVNLAARLCSRAMPGEIYIDENTRAALSDDVEEVEAVRESLVLKGFAQPVPVFRLHILRTVASA